MAKELTEQEIREMFRKMDAPGSSTRELADWHARDGQGPVPEAVKRAVATMHSIPVEVRDRNRKRLAKHRD